jgi:L-threonylcarbamoyladenylate synthase
VALALLNLVGLPLAAPSANRSGEVSPTTAEHVLQSLGDRVALVLDGGPTSVGIESTVLDLSEKVPVLLRPGMLSREEIESEIGPILVADRAADDGAARPSPGMQDRHYAPRAQLMPFDPAAPLEAERALRECRAAGGRSAALLHGPARPAVDLPVVMPGDPANYARELYAALHRLDESGVTLILAELPPAGAAWDGIRDRLTRASRGRE